MAEHSPTPWRMIKAYEDEPARIIDADDDEVAVELIDADAALIVEAVNYYKPDLHCDWRELTPEEAVAHCREVAERLGDTPCARDHLQLAAWIEERDKLDGVAASLQRSRDAVLADADRLRDLVRRMIPHVNDLKCHTWLYDFVKGIDCETDPKVLEMNALIDEARKALGEHEP